MSDSTSPTSYAPEVIADSGGKWSGNALRFATEEEAQIYVADLQRRWFLVTETRVIPSSDPVNYEIKDGRISPLNQPVVVHEVSS